MKTDCQLDYQTILSGHAETVHLAIVLQADKRASDRQQPFAFGLVLDNSGSMSGKPLEFAKSASSMVLRHLREDDLFGLVVFSNSARTVVPLQTVTDKDPVQAVINSIREAGNTNLTAGWMLGRDELSKAPTGMPRKLLLLTDGLLNAGIIEPMQVRQIVGNGLESAGIRTSCLGFGDQYNEDLLDALAKAASGALHDADSPEKFPAIFRQELESMLGLSVQNLRVRIRRLHYCSGVSVLSDYPIVQLPEGGIEIAIGDLVSGERRVLVQALEVLPIPHLADGTPAASIEGEALLDVEIAYDDITDSGITSRVEQHTIRVLPVQDASAVRVNEQVVQWVAEQEAGRAIAEAISERDRGDVEAVRRRIETSKERLRRYESPNSTGEALRSLDEFEKQSANWTSRSRKSFRYFSTRSRKSSSYYRSRHPEQRVQRLRDLYREYQTAVHPTVDYAACGQWPGVPPVTRNPDGILDSFRGGYLGSAVGDALGRCATGRQAGGERIADYRPMPDGATGPLGRMTGNTELIIRLTSTLAENFALEPANLILRFTMEELRDPSATYRAFEAKVKAERKNWMESGMPSAGSGAAVRAMPVGFFHSFDFEALRLAAILQAVVTHCDPMAVVGAQIVALATALLLRQKPDEMASIEARQAFCRTLAAAIEGVEPANLYRSRVTNEPATLHQLFSTELPKWLSESPTPAEVVGRWGSGGYILETLPLAFYCFLRSPHDFQETLVQAANSSRASATVAAIAAGLSGTLNGSTVIAGKYLQELEALRLIEWCAEEAYETEFATR